MRITLDTLVEIFIPEYPIFVSSTIFSNRILQYLFHFTNTSYNVQRTSVTMNITYTGLPSLIKPVFIQLTHIVFLQPLSNLQNAIVPCRLSIESSQY